MRPTRFCCATRLAWRDASTLACVAALLLALLALMVAGPAQACQVIGMQPGGQGNMPICANHNAPAGGGGGARPGAVYITPEMLARFDERQRARSAETEAWLESERLRTDPGYRSYMQGAWTHFDSAPPADGSPRRCGAMFTKQDRVFLLNGNADTQSIAMLTMVDLDPERSRIPRPAEPRLLDVSLEQTGAPRAVLRAWNYELGSSGAITFAVPSLRAGVDGLTDTLHARVRVDERQVFELEYHGGAEAQARLRSCMGL